MNCKQASAVIPYNFSFSNGYDSYQWLNHYALFSGGYREDAVDCMEKLVQKYGENEDEDSASS